MSEEILFGPASHASGASQSHPTDPQSHPVAPAPTAPVNGHAAPVVVYAAKTSPLPWVLVLAMLIGGGFYVAKQNGWIPKPDKVVVVDATKTGKAFAPALLNACADGFDAEADLLDKGKTVAEANDALKKAFAAARSKAFATKAAPTFEDVLPAGSDIKDDKTRAAFSKLHRDFATGLREQAKRIGGAK